MYKKILSIIVILAVAACLNAGEIKDGRELIKKMYEKYNGKWHKNITYTQVADLYNKKGDFVRKEISQELISMPGKLIVKVGNKDSGDGHMYKNETTYIFKDGELVFKKKRPHFVILSGYDVYSLPPDTTADKLECMGYDLTRICETTFNNRDVFIVGVTDPSDKKSSQLWVDKKDLYLVKSIIYDPKYKRTLEVILTGYKKFDEKWLSTGMIFKVNDRLKVKQKYVDITFPTELPEDLFSVEDFEDSEW